MKIHKWFWLVEGVYETSEEGGFAYRYNHELDKDWLQIATELGEAEEAKSVSNKEKQKEANRANELIEKGISTRHKAVNRTQKRSRAVIGAVLTAAEEEKKEQASQWMQVIHHLSN